MGSLGQAWKDSLANCLPQGSVYEAIIQKVIAASKNDFDEFGVDQSTLDEMKQVCGNYRGGACSLHRRAALS